MPSSPRHQRTQQSRSRSASNISSRSSKSSPYRNAAQQTTDTGHHSQRRQHSSSPARPSSTRSRTPSSSRPARKRFGLNIPTNQPKFVGKFDFEEKYPEDPINEEMGPNARVWRAFLDECEVFDADMVTEARDGLDMHLVFAGLFSAVLTTFVVQTSQTLSGNFPSVATSLLVEMVALQRAQINGSPLDDIRPSDTNPGPSSFDLWVNALWFTSLALSLGTALVTVLVKQWLYQYMSMISGTARDRSLIRQYRFEGLQKWHVLLIIGTVPVMLHIALGLFLAGLVIFIIPLSVALAFVIGFITLIIYAMYIVSNILPLIYRHCPYRTPFSDILNVFKCPIRALPSSVQTHVHKLFPSFRKVTRTSCTEAFRTLKEAERIAATGDEVIENTACSAVLWLYHMTSNPPTKRIILESLGCLSHSVSERFEEVDEAELMQTLREIQHHNWDPDGHGYFTIIPGQERRTERLMRGPRQYPLHWARWKLDATMLELPFQTVAALLTRNSDVVVDLESQTWNRDQFLVYLIRQHLDERPIRLPSVLWVRLISFAYTEDVPQLTGTEDDVFLLSLCELALVNFSVTMPDITLFSDPVGITHWTVPLFQFVVDLIVARLGDDLPTDAFDSEPLTKLCIIHDYAVSRILSTESTRQSDIAISVMGNSWSRILWVQGLSENDTLALCQRAENVVLRNLTMQDGWCESDSENQTMYYYARIINTYYRLSDWLTVHPEFFERLVSDFCLSLNRRTVPFPFTYFTSSALQNISRLHTDTSVYYTLFCSSPFLPTRTLTSLFYFQQYLYPIAATFIYRLTGGVDAPREAAIRCMNDLCVDPQRLYTVCRVIALGGPTFWEVGWEEDLKEYLVRLARFNPIHAVWTQRARYMCMDPRDWPYLHIVDDDLDDEGKVEYIKERMMVGLAILDEFFASLNHNHCAVAQIACHPPNGISLWKRIWRFVPGVCRNLRPSPYDADTELGAG